MPFIQFWIFRTKTVDMYFRAGFGAGVLSKHYNAIDNPTNNVIGSTINNITQFKIGFEWKLSPHVYLKTSGTTSRIGPMPSFRTLTWVLILLQPALA
jgi:hypothetical protein